MVGTGPCACTRKGQPRRVVEKAGTGIGRIGRSLIGLV